MNADLEGGKKAFSPPPPPPKKAEVFFKISIDKMGVDGSAPEVVGGAPSAGGGGAPSKRRHFFVRHRSFKTATRNKNRLMCEQSEGSLITQPMSLA